MAKIKHTKNELKAQREALRRFERFLPMLQLKKQQLQSEIQAVDAKLAEKAEAEENACGSLDRWSELLSEPVDLPDLVRVQRVELDSGNIAGVVIPLFRGVTVARAPVDLFSTPPWVDDAADMLEQRVRLRIERQVLEEQRRLIVAELRSTTQRVNLFEKVKIPEARENIRVIRIFLGDEQTASVVRGKIAKRRSASELPAAPAEPLEMSA
jgi:V/A-type H+-transporting ATPase subunit D